MHYMQCRLRPEEGIGHPETGLEDSCEQLCGYWEWSLEEQPVFTTRLST